MKHDLFFGLDSAGVPPQVQPARYADLLARAFGPNAARVGQEYPLSGFNGSATLAWSTVSTDASWVCPALRDQQASAARAQTFGYEFSRPDTPIEANGLPGRGAAHASEIRLLFGQPAPTEAKMASLALAVWSSFARLGQPLNISGPDWPAASPAAVRVLDIDLDGARMIDAAQVHRCAFWNTVPF